MRLASLKTFFIFLFFCIGFYSFAQYKIPPKPAVLYPIYDEVGLLNPSEKEVLNQKLIKFEDSTSVEIEVIIIPSTNGEDLNFVAWQFGEQWKIGKKDQNNGIVFLIATEDRKMSIQQGRDVEKYLTASVAGQIIDYIVTPNFKQGLWYDGINRGTTALMEAVQGKYKPIISESNNDGGEEVSLFKILLIAFIIMIILSFLFRNRGGNRGNYNDDDDDVIITRRGRRSYPGGFFPFPSSGGGFGGGSGGGGGFGGFGGGGSFGGGGASGGW